MPATAHFRAIRQHRVSDPRVLPAAPADDQHVRNVDPRFFLHDSALDIFLRIRPRVPLDDSDVLHHYGVLLRVDGKYASALARILAGNHLDVVALANLNGVPLSSFVS